MTPRRGIPGCPTNRRQLLKHGGLIGMLGATSCATVTTPNPRPNLGIVDITVRRELARDYPETLRQLAAMGYGTFGFRLYPYPPGTTAEPSPLEKASMVRDAGMTVGVVRLSVRNPDYRRELAQAAAIGATIVALTTAPIYITGQLGQATRADLDAWIPQLQRLGELAREHGLTLAYHNHWFDFFPLGGEVPLYLIARMIPPSVLSFEVDLAWCWYGGVAPLDLLAKFGPRVVSMHFKDIDRTHGRSITDHAVAVGSGEMDYAALLPRIRRLTSATGYVEVDAPADGLAAAAQAIGFMRSIR
jgi:sugar phosphate isomerase/epimerase